jgi:succinoglycan biosynthesis transport protein ExoP
MDTSFDLATALQIARRRAWIVVVSVAAALAAAYGVTQLISPTYEATATLFIGPNVSTDRGANDLQHASLAQSLAASYSELAETRAIAETAARSAGLEARLIVGHVESEAQPGLQILKVTAEAGSPFLAERVANAVAHTLISRIAALSGNPRDLGAEIVDPARSSGQPVSPRLLLNLVFGGLLGFLAGLGLAAARQRLDQRIRTADDVERELGVPLLGVVPKFRRQFLRGEALARHANPEVAEPYRGIAAVLASSTRREQSRAILITSARPQEGKTTVAAHLAVALAEDNRKVGLVEADLRRPSLRRHFPSDEAPTLNDVLYRMTEPRLPKSAQVCPGLTVVSADESPGDAALVLRAPEFEHALGAMRSGYDHVVLVGPPALPISDTAVLTRHAESIVLVVRAGSSRVDDVRAAQAAFKRLGVHLAGVVLVGARVPRRGRYSYGAAAHGPAPLQSARSPIQEVKPLSEASG